MLEDTEDGTSASAHGCIYGTQIIELLFDFGKFGMHRKDRGLEIVDELILPGFDRLAHDVAAALGWLFRGDGSVGILGAYGDVVALHHHDVIALHVVAGTAHRHQLVSDTLCIAGCIAILRVSTDEVSTVGTQFGSISFHLRYSDVEAEAFVEQADHVGCIS